MIIGLLGAAGSGKTTAAKYLAECWGAKRYSLADPLKQVAMRTLDFAHEQCYGTQAQKEAVDPRYGFSARWFLQRLGTEGCRETFGASFWTDRTLELIARDKAPIAVIEDVRFVNEATAIRLAGGVVWRLECPDRPSSDAGTHASEREWVDAPYDERIVAKMSEGSRELLREVHLAMVRIDMRSAR
jgi:hypothetical protein